MEYRTQTQPAFCTRHPECGDVPSGKTQAPAPSAAGGTLAGMIVNALAVAGGAFVGGCCRSALADWLNRKTWHIPWGTFVANMLGSLVLGVCLGRMGTDADAMGAAWKALVVTGFCGGFTTFSTFTGEVAGMITGSSGGATGSEDTQGRIFRRTLGYWGGSVLAGLAMVAVGFVVGGIL